MASVTIIHTFHLLLETVHNKTYDIKFSLIDGHFDGHQK